MIQRISCVLLGVLLAAPAAYAESPAASTSNGVTLEQIMANPDWIGHVPEGAYWSDDGKTIYYRQKRADSPLTDLYATDVASGATHEVADSGRANLSVANGDYNHAHTYKVFIRDNNVFVRNLLTGSLRQLTRDSTAKRDAEFMADGTRVQWHEDNAIYVYELNSGLTSLAADLRLSDDPAVTQGPKDYLQAEQTRLFEFLSQQQRNAEAERVHQAGLAKADATQAAAPWYLGDRIRIDYSSLSPDGRWMVLITQDKNYDRGAPGMMPNYITDSGYADILKRHTYVGHNPLPPQSVTVLDLQTHTSFPLDLTQLPGMKVDPLATLRKSAVEWDVKHGIAKDVAEASVKAPAVRPVSVTGLEWNDSGDNVALQFRANDNKDRWLATVDFADKKLVTQDRLTDPAWINWSFNDYGWLHDNRTLWYLSEVSGYSQLYLKDINQRRARQLTSGEFEISAPTLTRDDKYLYVVANRTAPGTYEIYRVATANGDMSQITRLGGANGPQPSDIESFGNDYALSPDESKLMFYHSSSVRPPEVYVTDAQPGSAARQLTHGVSAAFTSIDWTVPQIVQVPSTHVKEPVYARLYVPKNYDPTKSWPAVVFIHGAGYLQDAHAGWSYYFHELMFDTFLNQHGYLVIDMDYRGSAGYGRNWRTAIYQHMGHPEVEDIEDGVHWLQQKYHVDPNRLGVYGGSYGGFMTYMMMFRRPDLFQAGAALRPVGDWADYNEEYTSNILNEPNIDPEAYFVSSPINYAGQLKHHLLILQGMEDDNVFFIDTVHMVQKLQELRNPNFDVMFYPTEHHDFKQPYSWLDEYRRIWHLFETYVNPPAAGTTH
ncbi:MAG TPA: prolyl oligopeptidase family serine peptidase [Gammaproteobacteria bacterium]|nr:prolyl oligopeptidase family serine peptidase [Gammaproteobacteria bacterium]